MVNAKQTLLMKTITEHPEDEEEKVDEASSSARFCDETSEAPFSLSLAKEEVETFSPQDIENDVIIDRALGQIDTVATCIETAGQLRRNSSPTTSMTTMLKKLRSMYSRRRPTVFMSRVGDFDTTLQLIESLRGLGICLREVYDTELDVLVQTEKCRYIVERVSRIPNLVKTILLMKNEDIRRDILSLPIMTRVLLCKFSVLTPERSTAIGNNSLTSGGVQPSIAHKSGSWLIRMLKNPSTKEQGVQYLEIVSSLTVTDYMRMPVLECKDEYDVISLMPTKEDTLAFKQDRMELFQAISSEEKLILRLFTLSNKDMERAGVTAAVRWAVNEAMHRPFIISLVFCDFMFHMILLFVYRHVVFRANSGESELPGTADTVGLFCIFYFMFRVLADFSLIQVSWHVFWRSLSYVWSVIELCSTLMAIVGWIMVQTGTNFQDRNRAWFVFQAASIGLLWLRVLGFLQVMNRSLAAYIHSMFEILRDMGWFVIIMVVVIFAFGDMFYTIYTVYRRPNDNGESVCQGEAESPFCEESRGVSYLTMYRMFVGDIQAEEFAADALTIFLFVAVTFFGVIVLLNMLIAIVTTSYEGSHRRSDRFFGRARIAVVGKGLALEQLVRPRAHVGFRRRCISVLLRILGSLVLLLVCSAVGAVIFELLNLLLTLFSPDEISELISGIVGFSIAMYLWIILMVYLWNGNEEESNSCCLQCVGRRSFFNCCVYAPVRFVTLSLLGAKPWRRQAQQETLPDDDEQARRLEHNKKTNLAVFESWSKGTETTKSNETEFLVAQIENERRTELSVMEARAAGRGAKYHADLDALNKNMTDRDKHYQADIEAMEKRLIEREALHKKELEERDAQQLALLSDRDQKHEASLREMEHRILSALQGSPEERS